MKIPMTSILILMAKILYVLSVMCLPEIQFTCYQPGMLVQPAGLQSMRGT